MPRKPDRKKSFPRKNSRNKKSTSASEKFHSDRPFKKFERKTEFNPNADLENETPSYSERKRKNLADERKKPFQKEPSFDGRRSFSKKSYRKPFGKSEEGERSFDPDKKPFEKKPFGKKSFDDKPFGEKSFEKKPFGRKPFEKKSSDEKPFGEKSVERKPFGRKPFGKKSSDETSFGEKSFDKKPFGEKGKSPFKKRPFKKRNDGYKKLTPQDESTDAGLIRLNRYISNAGICSRREADELIRAGTVSVNGKVVTEMGYKVKQDDRISYGGETLRKEKPVYVLLNKPKDFITTLDDPGNRKTVFDLVRNACKERIYPVGRLDRNTTGILLLTNDGDLTKKLTHPKHGIKKVYHVTLDKPLNKPDFDLIESKGVTLEDGHIKPDSISYAANGSDKTEIGIEIHSGRNRVVRRLFEQFGYTVVKLDRVVFAGLTKKDLPRGHWRMLSEKEIGFLKMLG